jgi:hypothetical protein
MIVSLDKDCSGNTEVFEGSSHVSWYISVIRCVALINQAKDNKDSNLNLINPSKSL